jgi:hypothetical protein
MSVGGKHIPRFSPSSETRMVSINDKLRTIRGVNLHVGCNQRQRKQSSRADAKSSLKTYN